jgi:TldD protein
MNITMVGKGVTHDQGMCGSISGAVPTNCGQANLLVSEILVGGRGKE